SSVGQGSMPWPPEDAPPMNVRVIVGLALLALMSSPPQSQDRGGLFDSQTFLNAQLTARPTGPSPQDIDRRVRDLLGRMTLKEKIRQMTQLEIGMITDGRDLDLKINPAKLNKAIAEYGVGSILNVKDQALPIAKWHEIITAIQNAAADPDIEVVVLPEQPTVVHVEAAADVGLVVELGEHDLEPERPAAERIGPLLRVEAGEETEVGIAVAVEPHGGGPDAGGERFRCRRLILGVEPLDHQPERIGGDDTGPRAEG